MMVLQLAFLTTLALMSCFASTTDAALAIRVDDTITKEYRSWDPFRGESSEYSISGILLMGDVQPDCTVRVEAAAGPPGQAIVQAVDPQQQSASSIIVLRYNWLDYCATYDDVSSAPLHLY